MERFITLHFKDYQPSIYSGFKRFDRDKFVNTVLYFTKKGTVKTKLNKLLFCADFKHFQEMTISITGTEYAHVPFGPAPDHFDLCYAILMRQGMISVEEINYGDFSGDNIIAKQEPNLNLFSDSELNAITYVSRHFQDYNVKRITRLSHQEKGYDETSDGDLISYDYVNYLSI